MNRVGDVSKAILTSTTRNQDETSELASTIRRRLPAIQQTVSNMEPVINSHLPDIHRQANNIAGQVSSTRNLAEGIESSLAAIDARVSQMPYHTENRMEGLFN